MPDSTNTFTGMKKNIKDHRSKYNCYPMPKQAYLILASFALCALHRHCGAFLQIKCLQKHLQTLQKVYQQHFSKRIYSVFVSHFANPGNSLNFCYYICYDDL